MSFKKTLKNIVSTTQANYTRKKADGYKTLKIPSGQFGTKIDKSI